MERRALYNSIRLNYTLDPTLVVEPWQVQDYRALQLPDLFSQLSKLSIPLDRSEFIQLADQYDSPEEMAKGLAKQEKISDEKQDYLYLLLFELWRRLIPERQTLSLLCDELDYLMSRYDTHEDDAELLEDAIAYLLYLLTEEEDEGGNPEELYQTIRESCAIDIEGFLFDYFSELTTNGADDYVSEMVEGFNPYVNDPKWFALLKIRILIHADPEEAGELVHQLQELTKEEPDVEFHLEFLSLLVQEGDKKTFMRGVLAGLARVQTEAEFQELLKLSEDYFHCLDAEKEESAIVALREKSAPPTFKNDDPRIKTLLSIFHRL